MATIQDIARLSGYSIGTVSRVLNNRADVSKEAREKIEEIIKELNYQPNASARMLRQAVSSEITVIIRGINSNFLLSILEQIQICAREYGERVNVHYIRNTENEVDAAIQVVQDSKPKGLIFLGGSKENFSKKFSRIDVPSVLLLNTAEDLGFDNLSSFMTDDLSACEYAANVLIEHGHKRIGILGGYPRAMEGERPYDNTDLRIQGAVNALEKAGIPFDFERDYEPSPFSGEGGYQAGKRLLERTPDITGIFALSDSIGLGGVRAFRDMGLHVPKDISVMGYDGVLFAKYSVPRLTTIEQDITMLAKKAVDNLLRRVNYDYPAVHEKIPYSFIQGESVAQPRE